MLLYVVFFLHTAYGNGILHFCRHNCDIVVKGPKATGAHLGENPLFVGLRRRVSELRTQLTRFACSGTVLRSAALLAHSRIFKQMLIL